jgi:hypothetical protein
MGCVLAAGRIHPKTKTSPVATSQRNDGPQRCAVKVACIRRQTDGRRVLAVHVHEKLRDVGHHGPLGHKGLQDV